MTAYELVIALQVAGPGRGTDCVTVSASSLAKAEHQAALIVAETLGSAPGEARLCDADGRVIWTWFRLESTQAEAQSLEPSSPFLTQAK